LARRGFYPNKKGYQAVLNGDEMYSHCDSIGASWQGRLGDGYTHDTIKGRNRIHTRVKTTEGGFYKEAKTHALHRLF
jgi:hypothetical protein